MNITFNLPGFCCFWYYLRSDGFGEVTVEEPVTVKENNIHVNRNIGFKIPVLELTLPKGIYPKKIL